ncbi:leucine-rich repeat-containing protein 56 isoform a [Mus musculus]|uniref:Leucine-rich repeat-containing protein 56 n=5 Tax=Mus musculus TaxID=10090 RepID=LRC56_MOUSE|nr:leucine-rich repeat-containing protein 56 isoform a [Mus musculus]NP_001344754.1 leucine-rich repeat-containing protein 56 isoform a [Mus musculus]NP_722472.1 leucine-rich repeat-containing protein 56 isoform a [Mus musculus]Q8K375.1 RecName: Full=Leucine-rich repeat-containing protein 56 [Mus musculus]AAH27807.1 Leucine rich repeat containing 56 [Mus musculus]EDL18011.1 leucine rich repeat containing 56, isoform CRA_b [Mus musculus]|eukprot:NP_001165535.1 leucine-rich repeat-containing protein 56 isoform a [Mus musculus]
MDPAWDGSQGSRPGTASIRVRELSWQGLNNPHPQNKRLGSHGDIHRERWVEERLSPARLQALAQVDDLQLVRVLEMCVDTRKNSLGNFGLYLPNLIQLKLNHSYLGSLRDLGTSLGHLQVLWLARCGLTDLDGIGSFLELKELYVSYNNISDLSPLCLLEQLEVLDLEGNNVEDLGQMRYLQLCPRLAMLTLEGNLVCLKPDPGPSNKAPQGYNYRAEVKKLIPQLHVLDEVPTTCTSAPAPQTLSQDWLMVKEAIKEGSVLDILLPRLDDPHGATIRKFDPTLPVPETQPWALSLLVPGGPLPEGLLSENPATEDHASNLTHGPGQVLCGNPTKGLRKRRNQYQEWAPLEQMPPHRPDLAIRPSTPRPDPAESCDLAMTGLRAWTEPGLRPLLQRQLEFQQERSAQVQAQDPQKDPVEQEDQTGPKTSLTPPRLVSELSRTSGFHLIPSPPKYPMPPESGISSLGRSADLPFRGRRLRVLGSLGPSLGEGSVLGERLAAVTALRALEASSGPSHRAQGCPDPKPALGPAACPPGLHCLHHLNPIPPAHSLP